MRVDFCIPSCKHKTDASVEKLITLLKITRETKGEIHFTGLKECASKNRNESLKMAEGADMIIMLDDDMTGFKIGWDQVLIDPLLKDESIAISQALLLNRDGSIQQNVSGTYQPSIPFARIDRNEICTATFACWKKHFDDLRDWDKYQLSQPFDESFVGSGWEDNLFSWQLHRLKPERCFVVNNKCKLIHLNEMKHQHEGSNFQKNKEYFIRVTGEKR
jgi:hypothetical protein